MTVSQLRKKMMEKVVPEEVIPQNIISFLIDEDAEIPELDAFTFLNRLRSLGIGSADFLYLLKGCDAPAEAVAKIESNPAMNLNSLILTLDGAGLTSQDYTRMLYTARQLWERTLTMRLENVEAPEADVKEYVPRAKYAQSYPAAEPKPEETYPEEEPITEEADEELPEEAYEPIHEEASKEIDEEFSEEEPFEPDEETESFDNSDITDVTDDTDNTNDTDDSDEFYTVDSILAELNKRIASEENSETVEVKTEEAKTEEADEASETAPDEQEEPNSQEEPYEAEENFPKESDEADESDEEEEADKTEEQDEGFGYSLEEDDGGERFRRGALITSAVGAAVLFAAAYVISGMGFETQPLTPKLRYASDSAEIFAAVYESYNKGAVGGEDIVPYSKKTAELFGRTLLAEQPEGFGTFTIDGTVYVCEAGKITVLDGEEILPPDGEYVLVFDKDNALFAVYSGAESGFQRIERGAEVFSAKQDGVLTDVSADEDGISLGTAYVPSFGESFSITQTECYMPSVGGEVISADRVALSGEDGCGYALSAEYGFDGKVVSSRAVLCDPLFAGANGALFGADTAEGALLITAGEELSEIKTGEISAWAEDGLIATFEKSAEGAFVYLRTPDGQAASAMNNLAQEVASMRFDGNTLLISGEEGVFLTADCSEPSSMKLTEPTKVFGTERDGTLLTAQITDAGLKLTLYGENEDGTASERGSYTKVLTAAERESLVIGGANTAFVSADRAGIAYSYFDGVSVVSEFALFGKTQTLFTLYDDKTGITAVYEENGRLFARHNDTAEPIL